MNFPEYFFECYFSPRPRLWHPCELSRVWVVSDVHDVGELGRVGDVGLVVSVPSPAAAAGGVGRVLGGLGRLHHQLHLGGLLGRARAALGEFEFE